MKRILAILVAASLLLSLAACGTPQTETREEAPQPTVTETADPPAKEDGASAPDTPAEKPAEEEKGEEPTGEAPEEKDENTVPQETQDAAREEPQETEEKVPPEAPAEKEQEPAAPADPDAPVLTGLTYAGRMPLSYAQCFQVYRYKEGHSVIKVQDGRNYLVVPENGALPPEAGEYHLIRQPLHNVYLAATSAMSLFRAIDGLDAIRLSGTKPESWYVPEAKAAMEAGSILYSGKYSEPDFELLLAEKCDLAIENTMILHCPEVLEKIEELGITVLIDRSSYEQHPLGRTEWMKLYALLLGKETEAEAIFREKTKVMGELSGLENTGKTVAFFYVTARGAVSVRKSSDYLAKMIELAGGRYIFQDLGDPTVATSGMTMTMEDFYLGAKDADYLIYNATIDSPLTTMEELLAKSEVFADFKAVQNGNVWCTGKNLYQASDDLGGIIADIHTILTDDQASELPFLKRLS